jgi:RHS repeat-associated protein
VTRRDTGGGLDTNRIETDYYIKWYHNDHLGTPQAMTDKNRNLRWSAEYYAFGALASESVWVAENNIRFPGQYHDRATGLYYNMYRYYRPDLGRYLTPDPIGPAGGTNLYSYAGQNPINYTDPYGLYSWGELRSDVQEFGHQTAFLVVGFGDRVSNDNTRHLRGVDYYTDRNSFGYRTGQNAGTIILVALGIGAIQALVAEVGTTAVVQSCEAEVVSQVHSVVEGFTKHGLNRVINRGVSPEAILYTMKLGQYTTNIDELGRLAYIYTSDKAVVVVNAAGQVVTAWSK